MRNSVIFIGLMLLFTSCNDGDIITVNLDFDGELERCINTEDFFIYDTKDDPSESLGFLFPISGNTDLFPSQVNYTEQQFTALNITDFKTIPINTSNNLFNYRTYNRAIANGELCSLVAPADLVILEDYQAASGTVDITISFVDDDDDGIPSDNEGRGEPDENGNYPNAIDTDDDGIPNYLDQDDDNDNVPTRGELDEDDLDGDDNPLTSPLDTDGDGMPNYLDADDDGDGTPTRLEDFIGNTEDPRDDVVVDSTGENVLRYLSDEFNEGNTNPEPGFIDNTYTRTYTYVFVVNNVDLEIISTDIINLGTFTNTITINRNN